MKELDMMRCACFLSALLVAMATGPSWREAAAADPKIPSEAEKAVEQMRGISMQAGRPRSDGSPDPREVRRQEIVAKLRALGKKAVPALVQVLSEPDVQMRRNSVLVMISLAGPYEEKERVDITEA